MPDRTRGLSRSTPLAHQIAVSPLAGRAITLSEVSDRAMIDLRILPDDEMAVSAVESVLGLALPTEPRTSANDAAGTIAVLWLSIDQWLLVVPIGRRTALLEALREACTPHHATVIDLSDARAILRLEGPGSRETIMKGAAADLTRAGDTPGLVRRMTFAGIAAMVHVRALDPERLDLYVFRSYADYAWQWLDLAVRPAAATRVFTTQPPPPV